MGNDFEHCGNVKFEPERENWSNVMPSTRWMWVTFKSDGRWWRPKLENTENFRASLPYRPNVERMYMAIQEPGLPLK